MILGIFFEGYLAIAGKELAGDDMDADTWIGRFGGGVKYFFRDDIAVSLGINYDIAADDIYWDDEGNADSYNWTALLGLRFYFD